MGRVTTTLLAVLVLTACTHLVDVKRATVETNKTLVRRVFQALAEGDLATLNAVYDPNGKVHTSRGDQLQGGPYTELNKSCPLCEMLHPRELTVDLLVAEGDLVTARSTWRGTYSGIFRGITISDQSVEFSYTNVFRISDGRIAENWVSTNQLALAEQLGLKVCAKDSAL